jgi:surface polysaccharide O-acyltransferase-like enzyme
VFIAAISLLVLFKNTLNQRALPGLATISRYSLPIYGFHALFIHYLRTNHHDDMSRPWLDLPWVIGVTLFGSLLLAMLLKRVDKHHLVS